MKPVIDFIERNSLKFPLALMVLWGVPCIRFLVLEDCR